jgi:hypothetical protein
MEIKVLDQLVKINIDPNKKIGVMLSGGMDSAIMLFLLLKEIKENNLNVDLTVYNVPNVVDNAAVYSRQVIEYLENYFNIKLKYVNIGDGRAEPLKLIRGPAGQLLKSQQADVLYSGQNQFPSEAANWNSYKEASGNFVRRSPDLPEEDHAKYPFIKLYKKHILELYRLFDQLDLAKITHSCTTLKEEKCHRCLWCEERAWAFSELGLEDN